MRTRSATGDDAGLGEPRAAGPGQPSEMLVGLANGRAEREQGLQRLHEVRGPCRITVVGGGVARRSTIASRVGRDTRSANGSMFFSTPCQTRRGGLLHPHLIDRKFRSAYRAAPDDAALVVSDLLNRLHWSLIVAVDHHEKARTLAQLPFSREP